MTATLTRVIVVCSGQVAADHARCWANQVTVTDPAHVAAAKALRRHFAQDRLERERVRAGPREHTVVFRALPDYDALFGVDFPVNPATCEVLD